MKPTPVNLIRRVSPAHSTTKTVTKSLLLICFVAPLVVRADALDDYGTLTGKTVLAPSYLPGLTDVNLSELPADKTNAIARLESEFSKQGIALVSDGPHFVRIVPDSERDILKSIPFRGAELARAEAKTAVGTSEISLVGVRPEDVLPIYAALSQNTVLRAGFLPGVVLRLKTMCPLTREEAVYAMATVLALNGIAVVKDGEKFVQVVSMAQRAQVTTRAPKPDPSAKLLDPNQVPSVGIPKPARPLTKWEREFEQWQKAFYDFIHYQKPPERPALRLLEFYATLAGKTAESSKDIDRLPIWFHVETPLSKDELLYAIETTFTLNNLTIISVDDPRIRLTPSAKQKSGGRAQDLKPHIPKAPKVPVEK